MNKLVKILGSIVAVVVVLVVALVILAKVVITPERVKQTVLPIAEEALHRKLSLGEVSVSLFSGIELHDIKVFEANGTDLFVGTDLVRLKYQLLPLLAMKVVVDEVRVEQPQITVIRRADGSFNFSDLVGAGASSGEQKAQSSPSAEAATAAPINLLVSVVAVQNGRLTFVDEMIDRKQPFKTTIDQLDLALTEITLDRPVPVTLSCQINNARLAVDGTARLQGPDGDFKVRLDGLDATAFQPYFKDAVPGRLDALKVSVDTDVKGGAKTVMAKGSVTLSDLDLVLEALPEAPLADATIRLDYALDVNLEAGQLAITSSRLDFNGIAAEAQGRVDRLFEGPVVDLKAQVPGLDLAKAMASVPAGLVKDVKPLNPSGTVRVDATLKGGTAEPLKMLRAATVALAQVEASAGGQRPAIDGRLVLTGDQLASEGLTVRLAGNTAAIDLSAKNLFGKPVVAVANLSSQRFDLDPLLQGGGAAAVAGDQASGSAQSAPGGTTAKAEELGPFDIPAQASGTIDIGETVYKGLAIKNFVARYELKNNILTISRMDGQVAGGSFANTARVDLGVKGLKYDAKVDLKALQADPLITAFAPKAAGALLGAMDLSLAVAGRGTQWEAMSRSLSGQGDTLVANGKIVSPGMVQGLASILQMQSTKEIVFNNMRGNFRIQDGRVQLNSSIQGQELKLFPKGTIGLDGTLDLALDTRMSPTLAARLDQQGKVTRYLTDKDGWSQVPLLLSGTFSAPRFGLDPKGVADQAGKVLQNELQRTLQEKLFKQPQQEPAPDQSGAPPAEDPAQKLLKDSLNKLFGN